MAESKKEGDECYSCVRYVTMTSQISTSDDRSYCQSVIIHTRTFSYSFTVIHSFIHSLIHVTADAGRRLVLGFSMTSDVISSSWQPEDSNSCTYSRVVQCLVVVVVVVVVTYRRSSNSAGSGSLNCDTLILCALEIFLLTYLLNVRPTKSP